jgi:hypothetical protein
MIRVKKALEDNGAIVLLVREGGKENVWYCNFCIVYNLVYLFISK